MKKFRAKNGRTMNLTDKLAHALVKMGRGTIVEDEVVEQKPIKAPQEPVIEATQEPVEAKPKKKTK
jgi:hypothetical protein